MDVVLFVLFQLLLIAVNVPGMRQGYWWSYVATGAIVVILVSGLVYM